MLPQSCSKKHRVTNNNLAVKLLAETLIPEMCIFSPIVFLFSATVMFAFVCSCTAPYVAVGNLVMALLDHLRGRWTMKSTQIFSS